MHLSRQFRWRLFIHPLVAAALVFLGLILPAEAAPSRVPTSKIQNWTLANGDQIQAAIIAYSRQARIITLELPSGRRMHVAPRDLAGASKFDWLRSNAFFQSLNGYQFPKNAGAPVLRSLLSVTIGALLGGFLTFWISVSLLTGQRSIKRAVLVFVKLSFFALAISLGALLLGWLVDRYLGHNPIVGSHILIGIVYLLALCLTLAMTCRIIGRGYAASEWVGIRTLFLAAVLFAVGAFAFMIGMPRAMNQPGIDAWLTEQVLTPLELA